MPKKPASRAVSPLCRREEVDELVRSRAVVDRVIAAGWLHAKLSRHRYVVFSRDDVLAVLARLHAGEFPEEEKK